MVFTDATLSLTLGESGVVGSVRIDSQTCSDKEGG